MLPLHSSLEKVDLVEQEGSSACTETQSGFPVVVASCESKHANTYDACCSTAFLQYMNLYRINENCGALVGCMLDILICSFT